MGDSLSCLDPLLTMVNPARLFKGFLYLLKPLWYRIRILLQSAVETSLASLKSLC